MSNPSRHAANGNSGNQRLEGKIGYGLPVFGDRFTGTPEIGFGRSDGGRDYSLGWRLTREGRDAGSFKFAPRATKSISLTVGGMRVGSGVSTKPGATSRSELDRLASPDRADQYLVAQEVPYHTWIRATQRHFRRPPAPIRAPGLCHPTCPNRANYPVLSDL